MLVKGVNILFMSKGSSGLKRLSKEMLLIPIFRTVNSVTQRWHLRISLAGFLLNIGYIFPPLGSVEVRDPVHVFFVNKYFSRLSVALVLCMVMDQQTDRLQKTADKLHFLQWESCHFSSARLWAVCFSAVVFCLCPLQNKEPWCCSSLCW